MPASSAPIGLCPSREPEAGAHLLAFGGGGAGDEALMLELLEGLGDDGALLGDAPHAVLVHEPAELVEGGLEVEDGLLAVSLGAADGEEEGELQRGQLLQPADSKGPHQIEGAQTWSSSACRSGQRRAWAS